MAVLVTGATGFIALWVVDYLLKEGYEVIGTVRSQQKADKLTKQFGPSAKLSFEIVPDISDIHSFDHVFEKRAKEIDIVIHTASPFHYNTTAYEKDLLIPAVNGTKGILNSIKKYGSQTVKKLVITSSYAAILDPSKVSDKDAVFTEKSWNPATWENAQLNVGNAYRGSKKFAEKAAWDFLAENKDSVSFKLSTVNPVLVFGPQKFEEDVQPQLNTSNEAINVPLHSKPGDKLNNTQGNYIDVRDVAKAHVLAFQRDELIGERLGLSNGPVNTEGVLQVLNEKFPQLKGKLAESPTPGVVNQNAGATFDNSYTKKILGFPFISLEQSVYDTAAQILKKEGKL
ncbi:methylglyoxal reductase (NADPH-dependent) gre2 [Zygosaccharomyces mellis]|uniref:Methylglyoxal reductase (NADPH-dependent) gre2 n=1 Tax=Zygosaccharomyces mellis TaxID=42258 RepID=A0A4C2EDI1_9SACH|nr:methylglyoxal reductase (NADPH-dependent) gre2 [Zygosaccharomyces mellis]